MESVPALALWGQMYEDTTAISYEAVDVLLEQHSEGFFWEREMDWRFLKAIVRAAMGV